MAERNPLIFPERPAPRRVCPKCGSEKFSGRRIQGGPIHYTCDAEDCRHKWQAGLPESPVDPMKPLPPTKYVPPVQFIGTYKGGVLTNVEEVERRVDVTQSFRKGAPITSGEE